jgi:hypothetical protein
MVFCEVDVGGGGGGGTMLAAMRAVGSKTQVILWRLTPIASPAGQLWAFRYRKKYYLSRGLVNFDISPITYRICRCTHCDI